MTLINTTADSTTLTADSTLLRTDYDPYALPYQGATPMVDAYLGRVTPWQASSTKPKFNATVAAGVQPYVDQQAFVASLPAQFDIDLAIGAQLDVVGQWVGRDRFVTVPLPSAFFSFGIEGLGWSQAYWEGPYDSQEGISQLPDDLYRRLLYAKRASNAWDGTADSAETIVRTFFTDPATFVFLDDGAVAAALKPRFSFGVAGSGWSEGAWQAVGAGYEPAHLSLAYTICVAGRLPPAMELHILGNGLIPVQAAGFDVDYAVTSVNGSPLFGFGLDNDQISGFGKGAWGVDPATAAQTIA